jgi:nitrite reductase/ring-hydroxylating ferredoxin subunit
MPAIASDSLIHVCSFEELKDKGVIVVPGADRPIAVYVYDDDRVAAVDNRCPHLGFPLHKGSVKDGLLTCHWHEARFDLCSGCTFDLWADDVPAFDTQIRDGEVFVSPRPRTPESAEYHFARLWHGLKHEIELIQAKAILGLRRFRTDWTEIIREIARFGVAHHDDWGQGMTLLTIAGNLRPVLSDTTMYHVLLRASRQVAADCGEAVPTRRREPLLEGDQSLPRLTRWLCDWIRDRHRDGIERIVLTACERFGPSPELAELIFTGANERVYAQTGHVFDATNKAFELLDGIGWDAMDRVFPLLSQQTAMSRGAEENAHWHHPIELIEPLRAAERELEALCGERRKDGDRSIFRGESTGGPEGEGRKMDQSPWRVLLDDNPLAIIDTLMTALRNGTPPVELSKRVAFAAACRLARFAMTNEVPDWFNPRHTFILANAVHQAVKRSPTPGVVRGIMHAAISVYQDRFLNVPAARLPGDSSLADLPTRSEELRKLLLETLNSQADVDGAARLVLRHLRLGLPVEDLFDALAFATAREDFDFHAMQVLEAGVQQFREWGGGPEGEQILVGVVRQLAAFCPTPRAGLQTATIAVRLDRGDKMYENDEPV